MEQIADTAGKVASAIKTFRVERDMPRPAVADSTEVQPPGWTIATSTAHYQSGLRTYPAVFETRNHVDPWKPPAVAM